MSILHPFSGCENAKRTADVVFIHGLGGDASSTWRHGTEDATSWPHWLGQEFQDVGVWSLGYAASPTKWTRPLGWLSKRWRNAGYTMPLPDRAAQVLDLMVQRGLGQRPLFFICHSLGGLVAKQTLRKSVDATDARKQAVASNTRAVLFLATPHTGATLASRVNAFRTVFGASVSIEDLRAHDAHLRDLYDWYRHHSINLGIETATYYEMRSVKGILPIVSPAFAHPGVGSDPVPLDEDHISISKPGSQGAQVCDAARDLLRRQVLAPRPSPQPEPSAILLAPPPAIDTTSTAKRPHELPPAAEQFFGRQTELKQLIERLRAGKDSAVVGPAGLGKTALATEAVRAVVGATPATLALSPFPDGIVLLDLYTFRGQTEAVWHALANKLNGPGFMERSPALVRVTEACRARRILVIIEGGEEADGQDGRPDVWDLLKVLSPENRWLLLTRLSTQADSAKSVELKETLSADDAAHLLDSLTRGRVTGAARSRVLELFDGHPLALTWGGNLLARDDDDPNRLIDDWHADHLPSLNDPAHAAHTLQWLFNRSVRGLDDTARQVLAAAGLLAHIPFPLAAMVTALGDPNLSEHTVRDGLKSLVQRGLLRRSRQTDHWQFTHVLGYRFARKDGSHAASLRERLGHWLNDHLNATLVPHAGEEWVLGVTAALNHTAALLRADEDQRLWVPLANNVLYDVRDRLIDLGQLALVKQALDTAADWLQQFPAEKANEPDWLRERSSLLNRRGDWLRDRGNLLEARKTYQEALMIVQQLTATDPSNTVWQRDRRVSCIKIGDVLESMGDLAGALAIYQEARTISQHLVTLNPANTMWQRDLGLSHNNVGDALSAQGNLVGALAAYQDGFASAQRLAIIDPSNTTWQRDLSVSCHKIGDALCAKGNLTDALAAHRKALAIAQHLTTVDPSNTTWQRDLNVSWNKSGDVLNFQGNLVDALAAYQNALAIVRQLTAADPSHTTWQRDLRLSYNKVGDILQMKGDLASALASYQKALAIAQRLAGVDPSNTVWQRDLGVSYNDIGDVLRAQGDASGSLAAYQEGLAFAQRLATLDPSNTMWQRDLNISWTKIGDALRTQGKLADALTAQQKALAIAQHLAATEPSNTTWQRDVGVSNNEVGDVLRAQGNLVEALAAYQAALDVAQRLAATDPSNTMWQRDVSVSWNKIGDMLYTKEDLPGALAAYHNALTIVERLAGLDPSNTLWQRDVSFTLLRETQVYERQKNRVDALRRASASLEINTRLTTLDPTNAVWQSDLAISRNTIERLQEESATAPANS